MHASLSLSFYLPAIVRMSASTSCTTTTTTTTTTTAAEETEQVVVDCSKRVRCTDDSLEEEEGQRTVATAEKKKTKTSTTRLHCGDLFACTADSGVALVHCVSADLKMAKGIATTFRARLGLSGMAQLERNSSRWTVGSVLTATVKGRDYFNLVTKKRYFEKPTYAALRRSLENLSKECKTRGVIKLAMPKIGCGLDCLKWPPVQAMIENIFDGTDSVVVDIYYLGASSSS